jgi:hypothetical protein
MHPRALARPRTCTFTTPLASKEMCDGRNGRCLVCQRAWPSGSHTLGHTLWRALGKSRSLSCDNGTSMIYPPPPFSSTQSNKFDCVSTPARYEPKIGGGGGGEVPTHVRTSDEILRILGSCLDQITHQSCSLCMRVCAISVVRVRAISQARRCEMGERL